MSETDNDIIRQRKEKLKELVSKGIEPYGRKFVRSHTLSECVNSYSEAQQESMEVKVAGRVMAFRAHGKSIFGHLQDRTGRLQFYIKKDLIGEESFDLFSHVDIGDILGLEGTLFKTHTGEITILIRHFTFLSKSLRPLPEKWHGLKDVEIRYRQRYLDLISNQEAQRLFQIRSGIIRGIREFLDRLSFQEVETPMMQAIPGGAVAKPFQTHHEALGIDLFLRIAPELYLKRLLVGGLEKVYELNRNFRNEGISRFHNPEFSMLEVYSAYDDYTDMMKLTEDLFVFLCDQVIGSREILNGDDRIKFDSPWVRLDYFEAIKIHTGRDFTGFDFKAFKATKNSAKGWVDEPNLKAGPFGQIKDLGIPIDPSLTPMEIVNEIFEKVVQDKLIQPTFIIDYPIELCPLAKTKASDPSRAERFELFIRGQEIANAYSELNDPIDQARRFEEQSRILGKESDDDFVRALEYGMPCAGGLGIGIDRLVMILTGVESIREVIFFPQLRPESK